MRSRLTVFMLLLVVLIFGLLIGRALYRSRELPHAQFIDKKLRLLTYSTFVGAGGPGDAIIAQFKKEHACDVEVSTAGDAGLLLERLKIAQAGVPFDVVLGLDQFMLDQARGMGHWQSLTFTHEGWAPETLTEGSEFFVPFDWSPMSFVYRQDTSEVPQKFDDLLKSAYRSQFGLQDPRASSPGRQFYNWVRAVKGERTASFLSEFRPNVQSVSPTWAFSYGLFEKKQIRFVFSYLSSLAYHWGGEHPDETFRVLAFPEGHPVQTEYVAVPEGCRECELAKDFVRTMLEPSAQKVIMQKNFMFPVLQSVIAGSVFARLPQLKIRATENAQSKDLRDWDQAFTH